MIDRNSLPLPYKGNTTMTMSATFYHRRNIDSVPDTIVYEASL